MTTFAALARAIHATGITPISVVYVHNPASGVVRCEVQPRTLADAHALTDALGGRWTWTRRDRDSHTRIHHAETDVSLITTLVGADSPEWNLAAGQRPPAEADDTPSMLDLLEDA